MPELTPLDYPTASTAGSLIIRRQADALTIIQPSSARRTWQVLWGSMVNLLLGVAAGLFWWFWPDRKLDVLSVAGFLAVVMVPLGVFAVMESCFLSRFPAEMTVSDESCERYFARRSTCGRCRTCASPACASRTRSSHAATWRCA